MLYQPFEMAAKMAVKSILYDWSRRFMTRGLVDCRHRLLAGTPPNAQDMRSRLESPASEAVFGLRTDCAMDLDGRRLTAPKRPKQPRRLPDRP